MQKKHILEEIRRTAAANDGQPLGMARFLVETGIMRSDWLGKYWARWSDAIEEAELSPNKFGSDAIPASSLLEKLADLALRLGHLPVKGEVMLARRADRSMPSHSVYPRRLGDKTRQITLLQAFCAQRADYAQVAAMCEEYLGRPASRQPQTGSSGLKSPEPMGSVYLLRAGRHYKIGRTNSVGRRERELAIQLPERARLVHEIRTGDPLGMERYWHERFRDRRKNGEWFALEAADVTAFKRRTFM